MLFSPLPLHRPPLLSRQPLRLHPPQYLTEPLILFKNLDVIDTVSPGQVEQHQRKNGLLVRPPLTRPPHMKMSPDTFAHALHQTVFITMGTGFGSGIIVDGKLYHGVNDLAGEIGHVRLTRTGPVGYRKAGSVEGWVSGGGIAQVAGLIVAGSNKRGEKTLLADHLRRGRPITARDVGLAAQRGDPVALRIIHSTGRRLGSVLAILVDILNPERIVIGGLAMRLGNMLLDPARRVMQGEALSLAAATCKVVPAALDEQIGDVAALCVAMGF